MRTRRFCTLLVFAFTIAFIGSVFFFSDPEDEYPAKYYKITRLAIVEEAKKDSWDHFKVDTPKPLPEPPTHEKRIPTVSAADLGGCYGLCSPEDNIQQLDFVIRVVQDRLSNQSNVSKDIDSNEYPAKKRKKNWVVSNASLSRLGTQPKLILNLTMSGGEKRGAVFKPKLYDRKWVSENPCKSFDRHQAELAAYYLRKSMNDFVITGEMIGARLDLKVDIWPIRDDHLEKNSWINDQGQYCLRLECTYCHGFAVCGEGDQKSIIRGSISLWSQKRLNQVLNPWGSTCTEKGEEKWREDTSLCRKMANDPFYGNRKSLLDAIDASIFDFLTDNPDRHHFEYWQNGTERGFILLDNGKAFANPRHDDLATLAALFQCCLIRQSTYTMLVQYRNNGDLPRAFKTTMASDPLYPFLDNAHIEAVARRLAKVMTVIEMCIDKYGLERVIDGQEVK